jgi:chemotaxis protein histidine kinase CheA
MGTGPPGDADYQQIIVGFVAECGDLVRAFSDAVIALPDSTGKERVALVGEAFRAVHSVKGGAQSLEMPAVAELAHAMEDILDDVRKRGRELDARDRALLLECGDALLVAVHAASSRTAPPDVGALVGRLKGEAAADPAVANPAVEDDRTLRVRIQRVDALTALASELLVLRSRAALREEESRALAGAVDALVRAVSPGATPAREIASVATARAHGLRRMMTQDALRAGLLATQLIDGIRGIRLTSMSTLAGTVRRVVHDAAARANKAVELVVVGEQTELDKAMLDALKDPLVHLARNAVDHGIETPDVRREAGKPARGQVTLRSVQRGDRIVIELSDDGGGVDVQTLKLAAVRAGAIRDEDAVTADSVLDLMSLPGVSTRQGVGDLSGRGVGLDVARRNIEQVLGGTLSVTTVPGTGTTFAMNLPLNIATVRALVLAVEGQSFAIHTSSVQYVTRLRAEDIAVVEGRPTLRHVEGARIEVLDLGAQLQMKASRNRPFAVVVAAGDRRAALAVDVVHGEEEIVFKPFVPPLERVGPIVGGAVVAGDEPLLVLGAPELLQIPRAATAVASTAQPSSRRPVALIVDDSITTRSLEATILKKHGFDVVVATNGREALTEMRHARPDVLVSDLEMPVMDGLELCRTVRADAALSQIPIVLVTSVSTAAGRAAGLDAGADAYVEKGKFDQAEFLDLLRRYTSS